VRTLLYKYIVRIKKQAVVWTRMHPDRVTVDRLPGTVVRMTTRKVTLDVPYDGSVHRVSVRPEHVEVARG
jgi:hypothetical protein